MATPCSVKAMGNESARRYFCDVVTICDLSLSNSCRESRKAKSSGKSRLGEGKNGQLKADSRNAESRKLTAEIEGRRGREVEGGDEEAEG
jgi:uncharacterized protein YdbL (DUF1318 family)